MSNVRVRFAPSPTGPINLGGIRTALFNWLFAKHENGQFLLRIEDTDKERSKKEYEKNIIDSFDWLGLKWDEEIVRQSERLPIYEKYLLKLLEQGNAYWCFCSAEELELERQSQLTQGLPPKYGGRCRRLSAEEVEAKLKAGSGVIRFKMPDRVVAFSDLVRGRVEFNAAIFGDIIIAKGLREPLYNFAASIDDHDMKITHVFRGEEHLSNTPKQILIDEALGLNQPHYAHLPLILGPDRKKLSKRFLDKSLLDFRSDGYLREAILNFLVLLGWHPIHDREVLSVSEMAGEFDIKRVQKAGAIFNPEKLDWLNSYYIRKMGMGEFLEYLKLYLPESWQKDRPFLERVISIEKDRMRKLSDFKDLAGFFFELPDYPKETLIWKGTAPEIIVENLAKVSGVLEKIPAEDFDRGVFEKEVMALAEERGRGEVLWPLRVALSGLDASPGPIDLVDILGRKETMRRIAIAEKKLKK
jgi:glutamyl-tRNA synthetase